MVKTLKDLKEVYDLLTSKDLSGTITDDNSPDMLTASKALLKGSIVLMPTTGTMFTFTPINSILYETHLTTTILEKGDVYKNTLLAAQWIKDNTDIEVLICNIPQKYESTKYYAEKIGMKQVGVLPNSFLKDGERINIDVLQTSVENIIRSLSWQQS